MITIYDQKKVNIRWEVFKSVNNVHEDFSQAEVWMFLVADEHKYPLHTALDGNFVTATIDGGAFAPGSYSAVLMWLKNPETSKDLTRTELDNIFALTPYEDEDTSRVEGDVTVTLKSMVATYGYDGLDAYERAIMLGRFWGSEEEWMQSLGDHDLANYYTKGEVDELIDNVEVDLTDYYTKGQTDAKIDEAAGGLRQAVQTNTDDIETAKTDITDMGRTVSDHTTAIGQNTEDIAADSERILANEGNIASLQGSMTSMGGRVSTLETKVDNFVGLNQSNYKGMFDVNSLPSMTEIGWAWVGTDMAAMAVYVWFNSTDGWTRYGSNTYDLTDYSGVVSQLATIGLKLGDLANLHTTNKTNLVAAINEVRGSRQSGSGFPFAAGSLLIDILKKAAYIDTSVGTMVDELADILLSAGTVVSIDATFTQPTEEIYQSDSLDVLKPFLFVTATNSDGTVNEIHDYRLTGELVSGQQCTITVSYYNLTDTFNVTVASGSYYYKRDGSLLYPGYALVSTPNASYEKLVYDGVEQVYTRKWEVRGCYPFFDLTLPNSGMIRVEFFATNIDDSLEYEVGLQFFNARFQADGLDNVIGAHNANIYDNGWNRATKADGYFYIEYDLSQTTGYVGTRISLRAVNSGGTQQNFPTDIGFTSLRIVKLS